MPIKPRPMRISRKEREADGYKYFDRFGREVNLHGFLLQDGKLFDARGYRVRRNSSG